MSFFLEGGGKKTGPSHPCNFIIKQCLIFLCDFVTQEKGCKTEWSLLI